ncbi:hypothetical protein [Pseudorhizobium endolithicum]|uniref:hypothetical protein n=1 Tax=Pseudorhizobium endolithicum TaxID=1191678 RepID=UPI00115706CE|nr:hypothetical protein [Pseudorhizobium endolithicum]
MLAIYPFFCVGELVNIHRAAHDEGETGMEHQLANLPAPALITFGPVLAVIFAGRYRTVAGTPEFSGGFQCFGAGFSRHR